VKPDNEAEFLLACARHQLTPDRGGDIRSAAQKLGDWERLLRIATRHGVVPILHRVLSTECQEVIPASVLGRLGGQYQAVAQHNEILREQLLMLLSSLETQDLPALTFKGPELAAVSYPDPVLRPFGDLDLLVRVPDVPRASELLRTHGYRLKAERDWQLFFVNDEGAGVDLHWKLGAEWLPDPGNFQELWARGQRVAVGGGSVTTLGWEDLLLVLAILLTKDCMYRRQRLIQICDVAALLRTSPSLDWPLVLKQSQRTGTRRMLLFQLALAHLMLGVDLPPQVAGSLRNDLKARGLAQQVSGSFFLEADHQRDPSDFRPGPGFAGHSFFLQSRERRVDRVQYVQRVLPGLLRLAVTPTARDRAFLPLPELLRSLYYLVRPVRVVWRWVRSGYLVLD